MTKQTMPTKQQLEIETRLDADLARIANAPVRAPLGSIERRKRDNDAFILPIAWVEPDPDQVRKTGKTKDNPQIQELARSIAEHGQMQPIEVRELKRDEQYMIVAGEGRYVAIKEILGLSEIAVRLVNASDEQIVWRQLHENIHRRGLHPLDLAEAIQEAMKGGLKLVDVANKLGKSETWVQKAMTVAEGLTADAKQELRSSPQGESLDIGYEVATVEPTQQLAIAKEIKAKNLTRDQARELAKGAKRGGDDHRSGRTGRKSAKKPFALKWSHESGITFSVTSRKKNVTNSELTAAADAFLKSMRQRDQKSAA